MHGGSEKQKEYTVQYACTVLYKYVRNHKLIIREREREDEAR